MGWEGKWVRFVFCELSGAGVGGTRASCRSYCRTGGRGGWWWGVCFQRKMEKCWSDWGRVQLEWMRIRLPGRGGPLGGPRVRRRPSGRLGLWWEIRRVRQGRASRAAEPRLPNFRVERDQARAPSDISEKTSGPYRATFRGSGFTAFIEKWNYRFRCAPTVFEGGYVTVYSVVRVFAEGAARERMTNGTQNKRRTMRSEVGLFYRPKVAVQPIERFLDHLILRDSVAGVVDHTALLSDGRPQQAKHGLLRGRSRPDVIVTTIQHQTETRGKLTDKL